MNLTKIAGVGLLGLAAYIIATEEHPHGKEDYPYNHMRAKPFPWYVHIHVVFAQGLRI
jgi:hypothetical protein